MVDAIYDQAEVKLPPQPMPANLQMRSTAYYKTHNSRITEQAYEAGATLGTLLAGQKKDLVLSSKLEQTRGRVAIYGWHVASGHPIQSLSLFHGADYADYSHGVRLVADVAYVDGAPRSIFAVLEDPQLAGVLNDEGPVASMDELVSNIMAQDAILATLPVTQLPQSPVFVKSGPIFGGFLGYNYQIDDVVLGVEGSFNWSSVNASGSEFRTRSYVVVFNGHTYAPLTVNVTDGAKIVLNDYGSLRVRGAWAYGNFLPYVLAGVTVAQIDTSRSVTVSYAGTDVTPQVAPGNPGFIPVGATYNQGDRSHGKYIFGFSAGLGIDYALASNIFLRGEVEYLQLGSPNDIKLNTTSIRTGMGLKF
jgi:opacity protein-like surface antigen